MQPMPQVLLKQQALLIFVNTVTIVASLLSMAILAYQMLVPLSPVYVPTPIDCSPESFLPQLSLNLSKLRESEAKLQSREAHLQLAVAVLSIILVSVAIQHFYS